MLHRERKPRFLPFRIPNPQSRIPAPPLHAYVYKSLRKADTYVYLAEREDLERLPEPLRAQLEPLRFVLDVVLTDRKSTRLNSSHSCAARLPSSAWTQKNTTQPLSNLRH